MLQINLENGKLRWEYFRKYLVENKINNDMVLVISDCGNTPYGAMPDGCFYEEATDINAIMHNMFISFSTGDFDFLNLFKPYNVVVFHNLKAESMIPYSALEEEFNKRMEVEIEVVVLCEPDKKNVKKIELIQDPFSEFSQEITKKSEDGWAQLSHTTNSNESYYIFFSNEDVKELALDDCCEIDDIISQMNLIPSTCTYLEGI